MSIMTEYRAMQVGRSGFLEQVIRQTPKPGLGEVLIEVEACGVCRADISDIERVSTELARPRVPGHEVVGRILALGENTPSIWRVGQRVGVGRLGGYCTQCRECREGKFQLCMSQHIIGFTCDGGYAEAMLVRATGLVSIPDELSSVEAAPVLCAGLATFNALRKSGAQAGDTVAILGIGGLGHMAVQYARRMGFKVIALGRGQEIAEQAILLGAHTYIDTSSEDTVSALIAAGGAQAILSTIGDMSAVSVLIEGLAPGGKLIQLGVGKELMTVRSGLLVGGELGIFGSLTGTPFEAERALKFSVMAEIKPVIEIMSLDQANEALQRVRSGDATFRVVLDLTNSYVTSPRITYSENEFK